MQVLHLVGIAYDWVTLGRYSCLFGYQEAALKTLHLDSGRRVVNCPEVSMSLA